MTATSVRSFPLQWPAGFPRWKSGRGGSSFRTDFETALRNVRKSLEAFGKDSGKPIQTPVLSSNIDLNPLTENTGKRPNDPGVAVWFVWDGIQVCIPVDRYDSPAANLQAIHHIIEARRTELRHGTLALVRATFTGFAALPAPDGKHWSDILQCKRDAPRAVIETQFKRLAQDRHPDKGGSAERMAELNNARDTALREVGA